MRLRVASVALALAACTSPQPCPTPLAECGGQCVDVQTDPRHCGECGRACRVGEACTGGTCRQSLQAPCPDRVGGAFVTLGHCDAAVKVWVRRAEFIDEAAVYLGTTAAPRVPLLALVAGADCDAQWSWHLDDVTPSFVTSIAATGCDACPAAIQANVGAYVASGRWCPSEARVLAVDRRP